MEEIKVRGYIILGFWGVGVLLMLIYCFYSVFFSKESPGSTSDLKIYRRSSDHVGEADDEADDQDEP